MSGDIVIIRGFKGEPFVARICSANNDVAYITGNENYEALSSGLEAALPLSIPRDDVFQYDAKWYNATRKTWLDNPAIWEELSLWEDVANVGR